ncbi:MAG TPA: hypothetical protein VNX26_09255 [Candidatus Acidoferrum sp.]|jgi:hypothetical protein|nr:hypothetical protein [Candidatus Acidoferrum sp.]
MANAANVGSGPDPEVKACGEALQSAQKRTRIGFFFSLAASCIVFLMVLNLFEGRHFLESLSQDTANETEYVKDYTKHIVDNSFYQLPALGIQITCDDIGVLGPLTLLVFSFYSVLAFKGCYCHVKCATEGPFEGSPLIRALLETEQPISKPLFFILRVFLFVPFVASLVVVWYGIYAHFLHPLNTHSWPHLSGDLTLAKAMDVIGWILALLVFLFNLKTFQLSEMTKKQAGQKTQRKAYE